MYAAGCSMRVAGVGRVVEGSWTNVAECRGRLSRRMQLNDRFQTFYCFNLVQCYSEIHQISSDSPT